MTEIRLGTRLRWRVLKSTFFALVKPGFKILDIGGFDGVIASRIKEGVNGADITVLDVDEKGLELAKAKGLKTVNASATKMPLPDSEFDIVLALDVIEHIKDDKQAVCEMRRVLKPGGKLILATPKLDLPFAFIDESRRDTHCRHERSGYSMEGLRKLFADCGLKVIKEDTYFNVLSRLSYYFATSVFEPVIALEPFIKLGDAENIMIGER